LAELARLTAVLSDAQKEELTRAAEKDLVSRDPNPRSGGQEPGSVVEGTFGEREFLGNGCLL
jgi:hypothetical protein